MDVPWEAIGKLALAAALGGVLGAERELHDRPAGLRTTILICLGACLFTLYSSLLGTDEDPVRIAAAIVTGVGFLGAGVILRERGRVTGLTTAATVWVGAGIGMGVGGGFYALAIGATALSLAVLAGLFSLEAAIDAAREVREYEITIARRDGKLPELRRLLAELDLRTESHGEFKDGDAIACTWRVRGTRSAHERFLERLFGDDEVRSVRY